MLYEVITIASSSAGDIEDFPRGSRGSMRCSQESGSRGCPTRSFQRWFHFLTEVTMERFAVQRDRPERSCSKRLRICVSA